MRLNRVLVLFEHSYRMLHFVKKALFSLVQRFRNGLVYEFYGLKVSKMNKVCASSQEYPHVEKIKHFRERNFKANNTQLGSKDTLRSNFSSYLVSAKA